MKGGAGLQRLTALITAAEKNNFVVCLPTRASADTQAAGLALYLGLSQFKNVNLAADSLSPAPGLIGADQIKKQLSTTGNSLVVSFPYVDGAVDKVTYTIENNHFNLLIQPKDGFAKLDPSQVTYAHTGGKIDALIVIDAPSLEYLGSLYLANPQLWQGKDVVNIDRHLTNGQFGTINLIEHASSSTSEIILQILKSLPVEITSEMATNLYLGIKAATNHFTAYTVSAQTFENSAFLLKAGAAKTSPAPSIRPGQLPLKTISEAMTPPAEFVENKETDLDETPQDWLKPKIFKGSNLV